MARYLKTSTIYNGSRKVTRVGITQNHTIMKKGILLFLTMLLLVSTVEAKSGERTNYRTGYMSVYNAKPIQFTERGIKFYVFLDGEFDFNTRQNRHTNVDYLHKSSRRTRYRSTRGIRIERDYRGKIRRIGNVFINYNRNGKVRRIGNVFVEYWHRHLSKVGQLRVIYNHFGDVRYVGKVKRGYNNHYWSHGNTWEYDYDDDIFYSDNFHNDYESYDEDDDFLYYRAKELKKGKKETLIKRKKGHKSKRENSRKRKHKKD